MAGQKDGLFKEQFSPFLLEKLVQARALEGPDSPAVRVIEGQYRKDPREDLQPTAGERLRHFDAELKISFRDRPLRGVERLYRRVILIEPTTVCSAHCRWCLRGQYPVMNLSEEELERISQYCGDESVRGDLTEILITGGDPFMVPDRLKLLLDDIERNAPNIRVVRIGTRVPVHDPARVNDRLLAALAGRRARVEVGTHVNHRAELFPEVRAAHRRLREAGLTVYNQTVLLKDINDTTADLVDLLDGLRNLHIETHYLFHCIPMQGMSHHRTSLEKGLDLIREACNSGMISGRCKPMYTAMTDVGKVVLYEGVVLRRDAHGRVLLQSQYSLEDRLKWNPTWRLPESAEVDGRGLMRVWYLDAEGRNGMFQSAAPLDSV